MSFAIRHIRSNDGLIAIGLFLLSLMASACAEQDDPPCSLSFDCPQMMVCIQAECRQVGCYTNLDCPVDAICYKDQRLCGSIQCRRDQDCQDDIETPYCVGGICQAYPPPDCLDRSQCDQGETCIGGECSTLESGETCDDDEDCPNPEVCDPYQGEPPLCVMPCQDDQDCLEDEDLKACNDSSGLCYPVECLTRQDCEEYEICTEDHLCITELFDCDLLVCEGTDCPFKTEPIDGMCRCVQCLSDNHCSQTRNEVCSERKECIYCEFTGEDPSQCPDEHPFFDEGCCLDCLTNVHCEVLGLGSICNNGRCIVCNCAAGCPCPPGSVCQYSEDLTQGVCVPGSGDIGEECLSQDDCMATLACSYSTGKCVEQGAGSFCSEDGCPEPGRCALRAEGSLCYGCHDEEECPLGYFCYIPSEDWDFDGGLCLPSE